MARVVRKYGGSSLLDTQRIRHVARRLADLKWNGNEVVVVVSAMASTTDELVDMAHALHPDPPRRELDMLLSVGERTTCALLALAIEAEGLSAVSYTGSQVGIITDTRHGEARIVDIRPGRLLDALAQDKIVVVAGFQGVSVEKEITTLGRGGSDATAVALAAAIEADRCELMKDVDGLYTADPTVVEQAERIERADYESALRLSRSGTVALQPESVRIAQEYRVPLGIGNTATDKVGTIVTDAPYDAGEIVGIARRSHLVREQGAGFAPKRGDMVRLTEYRGRWVLWREGSRTEQAPFSALSLVTSGRPVEGLPQAVREQLAVEDIATEGFIESPEEVWVCVRTEQSDRAVQILHDLCVQRRWIRSAAGETMT